MKTFSYRNASLFLFFLCCGVAICTTTGYSQAKTTTPGKISASPCLISNGCVAKPENTDPIQFPLYVTTTSLQRGSWTGNIVLFKVLDGTNTKAEFKAGVPMQIDFAAPLSEIAGFKIDATVLNDKSKQPAGKPVRGDRYPTLQSGQDLYLRQFVIGAFPAFLEDGAAYVVDGMTDSVNAEMMALPIVSLINPTIRKITSWGSPQYTFVDKQSSQTWYDLDEIKEGDTLEKKKVVASKQNLPSISWCAKKTATNKGYSAMVSCMNPATVLNHDYGTSVHYSLPVDAENIDVTLHRPHYSSNPTTGAEQPDQLSLVAIPRSAFTTADTLVVILQEATDSQPFQLLAFSKK